MENISHRGSSTLLSAVVPLLKLLSLTLIGLVMGHSKVQIIPKATFILLSKLVFALFLPCLIFTHLGESITLHNAMLWWFIPVNVLICTIIGCMLGYLAAKICRPPPEFFRFTIIVTGFGNTGNLPIAIVGSICHTEDHLFGPDCYKHGIAYVSFAQWVAVILVYTLVYHMMEPPLSYELDAEKNEIVEMPVADFNKPLLTEAEWPNMKDKETEHCKTPFIAKVFKSMLSVLPESGLSTEGAKGEENHKDSVSCLSEPKMVRKIRTVAKQTPMQHILQPPTIASILAIVIAFVPMLKSLVFGPDAPLMFFTDSLRILAGAMVPSVMLILGGMLAEGPHDSSLGIKTTVGIVVARLLLLPLLGIGVVTLADKLQLLVHGDLMYRFVLLLQYTTPSAILLAAIANLRGYAVCESSALLFWQHVLAIFSLSVFSVIYFKLLTFV